MTQSSRIGILGGGQLARMLILAGTPLGLRFSVFDPAPDACAGQISQHTVAHYDDLAAIEHFAGSVDVVTAEFENVPAAALAQAGERCRPGARAFFVAQDRLEEKSFFTALGIRTPKFSAIDSIGDVPRALAEVGFPAVLKTRRLGYDGKGQAVARGPEDGLRAAETLGGSDLIAEEMIGFDREVSIIAVRSQAGEFRPYPVVENFHEGGILRRTIAPVTGSEMQAEAERHARSIGDALQYVGVFAVEFFERAGTLLANEMAPRVHNSGHWTIEGAVTSQFENHLRAVIGLPLGPTNLRSPCTMENIIGELPVIEHVLENPEAHLHLYGKSPAPGRKLGHITYLTDGGRS